jgi:hypothetical protein
MKYQSWVKAKMTFKNLLFCGMLAIFIDYSKLKVQKLYYMSRSPNYFWVDDQIFGNVGLENS